MAGSKKEKTYKIISVEEMRAADAYTIAAGTPSKELMYRAAKGVYDMFDSDPFAEGWAGKRTLILCGSGNNGGDGYALAMILKRKGHDVTLLPLSDKRSEDGDYYYSECIKEGVPVIRPVALSSVDRCEEDPADPDAAGPSSSAEKSALAADGVSDVFIPASGYDVLVDCMLGTGFRGIPREPVKSAIMSVNDAGDSGAFVLSVDINSGMNGDTGEGEIAVRSDLTVSIGYLKTGFFRGRAKELIGRLSNVDIGIKLPE